MGGNEGGTLTVRGVERGDDPRIQRDEGFEAQSEHVRREIWILLVVRQLEPPDEEQAVLTESAFRFRLHRRRVGRPGPGVDRAWGRIVEPDCVVGDAEYVEARAAVEVD